ncbi:MAG: hypothetical protein ABIR84_04890 [Candidatus Nitrotoga sp.]
MNMSLKLFCWVGRYVKHGDQRKVANLQTLAHIKAFLDETLGTVTVESENIV